MRPGDHAAYVLLSQSHSFRQTVSKDRTSEESGLSSAVDEPGVWSLDGLEANEDATDRPGRFSADGTKHRRGAVFKLIPTPVVMIAACCHPRCSYTLQAELSCD